MKIKVLKFGGTSVRTPESRMTAALRVVSAKEQGFHPVVVVSAIGRKGEPYATDTLIQLIKDIDTSVQPDARELDLIMSCGEVMSAVTFAQILKTLGHSAMAMRGGQAGIRTDEVYGNARILGINPIGLFEVIKRGAIPVVCGFQGVWIQGGLPGSELTTLGRGGSDTTAAALGAAVRAEAVEIYTDVDGVKSADPDFVKSAPTLRKVSYDEVAEIAHLGAKVLHPRAAEIAMKFQIPIWVKNTFSDDPGTEIVPRDSFPGRRVTGVTHTGQLVYVQFNLAEVHESHRAKFEASVYELLAKYGFNLHMVNISLSGIGFAVPRSQFPTVIDLFDGLVLPSNFEPRVVYVVQVGETASKGAETQIALMQPFGNTVVAPMMITEGLTMVSVVGHEYLQRPGVFLTVLSALEDARIPVIQTSDSDFSLSCLIPESELRRAVAILHDKIEADQLA